MRDVIGALALAAVAAVPAATVGATDQLSAGLIGRWQLNKGESEDARAKMAEARQRSGGSDDRMGGGGGSHHGGYGGGHGGGYGGHRGGGGSHEGSGGEAGGSGGSIHEFFEPPEALTVTGTDAELTLDDGNGELVRLVVDGKSHPHEGGGGDTKASWKGSALEVESKTDRGSTLTTTYAVDPATHKLEATTRLSGRGDPVSVRRVYDAAPAGS